LASFSAHYVWLEQVWLDPICNASESAWWDRRTSRTSQSSTVFWYLYLKYRRMKNWMVLTD